MNGVFYMNIKVNGEVKSFDLVELTVSDVIRLTSVSNPDMVSVQLNGEFVDSKDYDKAKLSENNEIDFLYFMGGGR